MKLALVCLALALTVFGLGLSLFSVLPRYPELADYERLWRAEKHLPRSLPELEELAEREDGVGWQARALTGNTLFAQGDYENAVRYLQAALSLHATEQLRAKLALALEVSGSRTEALREWERLLPAGDAVRAVIRLEADPERAARLLVAAGCHQQALTVLGPLETRSARLSRARALVGLGRAGEALAYFEALLAADDNTSVRAEYGRACERAGESNKALAVYRQLGASGAFRAGRMLEVMGRCTEAVTVYFTSSNPEARWRAGRLMETRGDEADALPIYRALVQGTHRVRDDAALRAYRLHLRRNETDKAEAMLNELPDAFCWILGIYRPPASPTTLSNAPSVFPRAVRIADALLATLPEEGAAAAEAEVDIALEKASSAERLAIGQWYLRHRYYRAAYRVGVGMIANSATRTAYELAYPLAWWSLVQEAAVMYNIDPLLILAVMREESNFSPTAVSSSGARGLMQLLPSTAEWIMESKLNRSFSEETLDEPEVNITLGAWYLAHLLDQFDSDLARTVAAYNGGPGNLQRWIAASPLTHPADLPAVLASSETREYLVKVLNSWLVYRWLYSTHS
jgi:soluble lytic murein transglycosylase